MAGHELNSPSAITSPINSNMSACFCVYVCVRGSVQTGVLHWRMENRKLRGCKSLVRHIPQFLLPWVEAAWSSSSAYRSLFCWSCFISLMFFAPVLLCMCVYALHLGCRLLSSVPNILQRQDTVIHRVLTVNILLTNEPLGLILDSKQSVYCWIKILLIDKGFWNRPPDQSL